eukprot:TRINITY_DN2088_c0_g1_i11.p1 TRINITY_DN2088_c0_g1~~TRINITY_DN2088_c0_g1_i11.p1  ORF type:complete len:217 (-),score=60.93 TRINITY_DN2088_c0_g1_i11:773-1423(-)
MSIPIGKEESKRLNALLQELMDNKESEAFRKPVDYKTLGLTDYPILIKNPMDLSTVKKKLKDHKYKYIEDCISDINLIWENCKKYNQEGSYIFKLAQRMEKTTKKLIKKHLPIFRPQARGERRDFVFDNGRRQGQNDAEFDDPSGILFEEQVKFSQKIKKLNQDELVNLIKIIQDNCPQSLKETAKDKIQIKVDDLDVQTYSRVNDYLTTLEKFKD